MTELPIPASVLDEIERGLDGVTPGPWEVRHDDEVWRPKSEQFVSGGGLYAPDAAHIARLDPDTVREIIRLARIGMKAEGSGWKLVPVEPTQAMRRAAFDALEVDPARTPYSTGTQARDAVYRAMLAASPEPGEPT